MNGRWFLVGIWRRVETPDSSGGFTVSYSLVENSWCQINPLKSYEKIKFEKIDHKIDHKLIFRFGTPISAGHHVIHQGRTFEIIGPPINLMERNQYLEALGKEVV